MVKPQTLSTLALATLLLDGQNVVPQAALALGYQFVHPDLPGALRDLAAPRAEAGAQ